MTIPGYDDAGLKFVVPIRITVDRYTSTDDATLSRISLEGHRVEPLELYGLEPGFHEPKIPGKTRIPAGIYRVGVKAQSKFDPAYRQKFGVMHEGMLEILDVPNFTAVLIHIGNDVEDTDGCLLVGETGDEQAMRVLNSRKAYLMLYRTVIGAATKGMLTIEFRNLDRPPPLRG